MHTTNAAPKLSRKHRIYILLNIVLAVTLLAAVPLLRTGKDDYAPHATVDKDYVRDVIATGHAEEVGLGLKFTEIARASAYEDYVDMLTVMQIVSILLVLMIAGNILIISGMRRNVEAPAQQIPLAADRAA